MHFLYPSFLWAVFAGLIPVIIHLFYFRRYKKIVFSDLRFLREVEQTAKSHQRLRDLLILICRILAITSLVFVFAQPFIPQEQSTHTGGVHAVCIYVDNSFSMVQEGAEGPLLEQAKDKARAVAEAYGNGDQYLVVSNTSFSRRWVSKTEALKKIDEIQPSAISETAPEQCNRIARAFSASGYANRHAYLISDFQHAFDIGHAKTDSTVEWNLLPVEASAPSNTYVDSAWLTTPFVQSGQTAVIKARIKFSGESHTDQVLVHLKVNGVRKSVQTVSAGTESRDVSFAFTPEAQQDWIRAEIELEDYPVVHDDRLFLSLHVSSVNRVLCVNGSNPSAHLKRVFSIDSHADFSEIPQQSIDYRSLKDYQLIILNQPQEISSGLVAELDKYLTAGGQVLLIPPATIQSIVSVNAMLAAFSSVQFNAADKAELKVEKLNLADPLFRSVFVAIPENPDYPSVHQYFPLRVGSNTRGHMLMELNNGEPFMWSGVRGKGCLVVSSVPLINTFSNFQDQALFVPLMLKLAMGRANQEPLYYILNRNNQVQLRAAKDAGKLVKLSGEQFSYTGEINESNGQTRLFVPAEIPRAGHYTYQFPGRPQPDGVVAFNYNRAESEMKFDKVNEIDSLNGWKMNEAVAGVLKQQISAGLDGTPLWRWFLLAAIVFLAFEMVLLRWMK